MLKPPLKFVAIGLGKCVDIRSTREPIRKVVSSFNVPVESKEKVIDSPAHYTTDGTYRPAHWHYEVKKTKHECKHVAFEGGRTIATVSCNVFYSVVHRDLQKDDWMRLTRAQVNAIIHNRVS